MKYDEIKNLTPITLGKIREETFGGLYYERDRLTIELLNDVAYTLLSLCKDKKTVAEIKDIMLSTYSVSEDRLIDDILMYFNYLINSNFIEIDGFNNSNEEKKPRKVNQIQVEQIGQSHKPVLGNMPYELTSPIKVLLELTYNCNLKCVHCFADAEYCLEFKKNALKRELGTNEWIKIIDNIIDAEVFEILLSGGEATMREDLIEIASHIKKRGHTYCLLSNTTLITDTLAKKLKATGCVRVESNLDGHSSEIYDDFRGVEGAFSATIKGIKNCLNNGLGVRCNVMETKKTVFHLKDIVDKAYDIGVREVCVVPLEQGGRAKESQGLSFCESDLDGLTQFYIETMEWFDNKYGETDMILITPYSLRKESGSKFSKLFDLADFMPSCGAGKIHCTIDPYGNVKLCPSDEGVLKNEENNLLHNDLKSVWQNSSSFNKIRGNEFSRCHQCSDYNCEDACPVIRYQKYGNLDKFCKGG